MNYLDWEVLLCLSQKLRSYKVLEVIIPIIFSIFSEARFNIQSRCQGLSFTSPGWPKLTLNFLLLLEIIKFYLFSLH